MAGRTDAAPRVYLLGGPGDACRPGEYCRRILGPRPSRLANLRLALAAARSGEVDVVHLVTEALDLSLVQLAEIVTSLRTFGVDIVVLDVPELGPTSMTREASLALLVRFRVRDRSRNRGGRRLRASPDRASSSPAVGRPRRPLDLPAALALLEAGETVKSAARQLQIPRSTLQRRLDEVGYVRTAG